MAADRLALCFGCLGVWLRFGSSQFAFEEEHDVLVMIFLGTDHFPSLGSQSIQLGCPFAQSSRREYFVFPFLHGMLSLLKAVLSKCPWSFRAK